MYAFANLKDYKRAKKNGQTKNTDQKESGPHKRQPKKMSLAKNYFKRKGKNKA